MEHNIKEKIDKIYFNYRKIENESEKNEKKKRIGKNNILNKVKKEKCIIDNKNNNNVKRKRIKSGDISKTQKVKIENEKEIWN